MRGGCSQAAPFAHRDLALTLKFRFDPPLQDVDHLDIHIVEMTLRHDRRITRWDEADDVRLQQAIGGLAHAEIAVFRVAPQAIRPKVFRSEVTDIERLLRPCLRLDACSNRVLARRLSRSRLSFASVFAMVKFLPYGLVTPLSVRIPGLLIP
jgi:hypothetical protein